MSALQVSAMASPNEQCGFCLRALPVRSNAEMYYTFECCKTKVHRVCLDSLSNSLLPLSHKCSIIRKFTVLNGITAHLQPLISGMLHEEGKQDIALPIAGEPADHPQLNCLEKLDRIENFWRNGSIVACLIVVGLVVMVVMGTKQN